MNVQGDKELFSFLANAPKEFREGEKIRKYQLKNGDYIHCVLWNMHFYVTGTDIVKILVWRFQNAGRQLVSLKKFEEGVFSDLRNLKPGIDATLEGPRSDFLEFLYKNGCIRTQKKQKVFFWYSVPHDALFCDALERDLRRETNLYTYSKYMNNLARQNFIPGVGHPATLNSPQHPSLTNNLTSNLNAPLPNLGTTLNHNLNTNLNSNLSTNPSALTSPFRTKSFIEEEPTEWPKLQRRPTRQEPNITPYNLPFTEEYTFNDLEFGPFDEKFFGEREPTYQMPDIFQGVKEESRDCEETVCVAPDMIQAIPNTHGRPQK